MATNSSPSQEPTQDAPPEVPESSQTSDSHQAVQGPGSGKKSARETLSSSGLLSRLKSARTALDRGIDWAERRRQADRDPAALGVDSGGGGEQTGRSPGVHHPCACGPLGLLP